MRSGERLSIFFAGIGWLAALMASTGARAEPSGSECAACHGEKDIRGTTERGRSLELYVPPDALSGSAHESLSCTDCHDGAKTWDEAPHNGGRPLEMKCDRCHEQAGRDHLRGVHSPASSPRGGSSNAPRCQDCHGRHAIPPLSSPLSPVNRIHQPATCGQCHQKDEPAPNSNITKRRLIERYNASVHWQALREGKSSAACADCHDRHAILPSSDVSSWVNRTGLVGTCGKCHAQVAQHFSSGSHGRSLLHGNLDVPNCVTCHGDHDIISLKSPVGARRNFAGTEVCIWCHGNQRMMARYALDTSPVESYMRDFHGLTQRGSEGRSATCADCHDAHRSLPSSHPESRMHISNRGTACGTCHGQSPQSFIMSFTHRTRAVDQGYDVKRIVTIVYITLILLIVGGMLLHNLIIWSHALRRKLRHQKQNPAMVRLHRFERLWHWLLIGSFSLLLFTGLALKYPDSVFFRWLYALGMTEAVRSFIHRAAAVILIGDMLAFLGYQIFTRSGRRWLRPMLPRGRDVRDLFATLRYYLGRSRERPRYAIFNYAEKAEYWALWWGTLTMTLTGLVLWVPRSLPESWPAWVIDLARIIHFLEAVLAGLAILVWHLFHTIFRIEEYPMDTSWLTGVLTEAEAAHRFTEEAIAAQRLPPPPPPEPDPTVHRPWNGDPPAAPASPPSPESDSQDR